MDIQDAKWEHYPRVAAHSAARSFVERLILKGKRPKTIDAYARAIEDLLAYFSGVNAERVLEADEADLDRYIASLISAAVLHLVRRYIESNRRVLIAAYDGEDRGQIFVSESTRNPGRPLAVGAFDEIVERVREKVGLPALTPTPCATSAVPSSNEQGSAWMRLL